MVIDRFGKLHLLNCAAENYFYQPDTIKYCGDSFPLTQYFDFHGKQLSVEEMAGPRALKGELIKKEKVKAVRPDHTV